MSDVSRRTVGQSSSGHARRGLVPRTRAESPVRLVDSRRPLPEAVPTTVAVVDPQRAFSEAIASAVDARDDLRSVGVAGTVREALALVVQTRPHVVVMDVHLPDGDGVGAIARIRAISSESRVVVLTADTGPEIMARTARAGAAAYLLKTTALSDILAAIRGAKDGGMIVDPACLAAALDGMRRAEEERARYGTPPLNLTHREREVVVLMGDGLDPSSIAKRLRMSIHTARGHVKSIINKLGVHTQLEAVVKALREGLIPTPSA